MGADLYLSEWQDSCCSCQDTDKTACGDAVYSWDEMETLEYEHTECCDDKQRLVKHKAFGTHDEAQPPKLDEDGDNDDTEHGQQQQISAEVQRNGRRVTAEREVASNGDQGNGRDEDSQKQTFVRLNVNSYHF